MFNLITTPRASSSYVGFIHQEFALPTLRIWARTNGKDFEGLDPAKRSGPTPCHGGPKGS